MGNANGTSRVAQKELDNSTPKRISRFLSASHWRNRFAPRWLALVPLGKIITILLYASLIAILITWKSIDHDDLYLERLGFRAAWVSTTQTTLCFLLAARTNPIGLILGGSYERINWLHRWASRVFFASVTLHGAFFTAEWLAASFFWTELQTVAIVKWGIFAWFTLLWMVVSSLIPIRRWKYEFFVVQHIVSAVLLLVMLLLHVPEHHHFSVWCAFAAFVYDVVTRSANPLWRNIRLRMPASAAAAFGKIPRYAFKARVEAVDEDLTLVTVQGVSFRWTPGQHVLIWSPTFRRQSPHPFTICGVPDPTTDSQDIQLVVKTKKGFTHQLNQWARRQEEIVQDCDMRVLLAGPYGSVPDWKQCASLVLISGSTGGTFTTPMLEDILCSKDTGCLRSVTSVYVVRKKAHSAVYLRQLARVLPLAKALGVAVHVEVAITGVLGGIAGGTDEAEKEEERLMPKEHDGDQLDDLVRSSTESDDSARSAMMLKEEMNVGLGGEDDDGSQRLGLVREMHGRPNIETLIRREIDRATGMVGIAVCAGTGIENAVKRSVASASSVEGQDVWVHIERAGA